MTPRRQAMAAFAIALAAALAAPARAQEPQAAAPATPAETEIEVTVEAGDPQADDFEAFLAGRPVAVTRVAAGERPWRVLVYVEPSLLTPSGLQDAAAALARRAEALTGLGAVEVVIADPSPQRLLASSRDAAAVRAAFDALADEGGAAGALVELRYELLEAAAAGGAAGAAASLASRLLAEEQALLARARQELLDLLAVEDRDGPRLLLLVSDGFDADPASFYRQRSDTASGAGAEAAAADRDLAGHLGAPGWEELSRVIAAAGWTAVPLAFGDPGPALDDPAQPLAALAAASGGQVVRTDRELITALDALGDRLHLTLRVPADPGGEPLRLEVAGRRTSVPVVAPRWAAAATPLAFSASRARLAATGSIPERTAMPLLASVDDSDAQIRLAAAAPVPPPPPDGPPPLYRLTVFYDLLDAAPRVEHRLFAGPPGAHALSFEHSSFEESGAGEDLRSAGVVLEEVTHSGWWTASRAVVGDEVPSVGGALPAIAWSGSFGAPPGSPSADAVAGAAGGRESSGTPAAAGVAPSGGLPPGAGRPDADRVIVLLPPRRAGLGRSGGSVGSNPTGRVRLETLVTRPDVARVVFYVDGDEAASDDREPFTAVVDLGPEPRPRRLRADALSAAGRVLGSSTVELAATATPFRVAITAIEGDPAAGEVTVEAELSVPSDQRLERVEWYYNETLAAQRPARPADSPLRAVVATPGAGPNDFLRVVAYLADGSSIEDARLLSARGEIERVAVNLVQLFAVVSDRSGTPLTGLGAEDFAVRLDGRELPLERFRLAEEVPLLLGLLVDTSESMWPLLPDTKRAAARFLSDTLRDSDRAFLVSFDDQPRLVRPPTADLIALLNGFGALRATGRTALYDAIVYSLLQMEGDRGRRALVLLTDGRDWGSRYGPRRATEYGQKLGVPVYVLVFGDLYGDHRPLTQPDLDAVTARTGGQVFYIQRLEELTAVYVRIAEELRSQYVLAVSTDRPLTAEELSEIEVDAGRGRRVRAAVGGSDLD